MTDDPYCVNNLALDERYVTIKEELLAVMEEELKKQEDPRMFGNGDIFHSYFYTWKKYRNLYDRMINKEEKLSPGWINVSDIENDLMDP